MVDAGAFFHPLFVTPLVPGKVPYPGTHGRGKFHGKGQGIGLDPEMSFLYLDLKLVQKSRLQPGHEEFPNPGTAHDPHRKKAAVPAVEIPKEADPFGVGGPEGKGNPGYPVNGPQMSAEGFI